MTSPEQPANKRPKKKMGNRNDFLCALLLALSWRVDTFVLPSGSPRAYSVKKSSFVNEWTEFQQQQTDLSVIEALVQPTNGLTQVFLVGQSSLPHSVSKDERRMPCLVLSTNPDPSQDAAATTFIPSNPSALKLLNFVVQDKPLSKSLLLTLNPLLVNRDGVLFDNLPWSTWTVDPQQRNLDASGNPILPKYHLGKRDAYQRFGGKDWKGRSVSIGNLAMRAKYMLDREEVSGLTMRILQVQIKELEEELVEWNYQLAVSHQNNSSQVNALELIREECMTGLEQAQKDLEKLTQPTAPSSVLSGILDNIASMTTRYGENAAPYRGAMGYAPILDTKQDLKDSTLPFCSPFGLMQEILQDQLNAKVIGAILENTSLLEGTVAVGGAVVLQRIVPTKTVVLNGEEVQVRDEGEDFGNDGIRGGETILVECDVDEAIGLATTTNAPILAESEIISSPIVARRREKTQSKSVLDVLPSWQPVENISFIMEGQSSKQSVTESISPIRIPRTTISLFDDLFAAPPSPTSSPVFDTDNPIQSLSQLDSLSNDDKARTLMTMSNFDGKLPRPRELRTADRNPLDQLLLPLIDESVRRQYLSRQAQEKGDWETVRQLESTKSKRQEALELAEAAREMGDEAEASKWQAEADLLGSLRADVTQDEGAYSRFLDRDEWYERQQRQRAERLKKNRRKLFGTLFDEEEEEDY